MGYKFDYLHYRFFFDFSLTYVGAGMICSHLVNLSLLLGAVLSWGVMWPLLSELKGTWYPDSLPESSMRSLQGYKVRTYILFMNMCQEFWMTLSFYLHVLVIRFSSRLLSYSETGSTTSSRFLLLLQEVCILDQYVETLKKVKVSYGHALKFWCLFST